jgi:hypothetical protein
VTKIKINSDPECKLLINAIVNTDFLKSIHSSVKSKYLKVSYSKLLWKWVSEYYSTYGNAPGKQIQQIYLNNKEQQEEPSEDSDNMKLFLSNLSKKYEILEAIESIKFETDCAKAYLQKNADELWLEDSKDRIAAGKELLPRPTIEIDDDCFEINGSDLMKMEIQEKIPLVPNFLMLGSLVLLVGGLKLGKSWISEQLAIAVASGGELFRKWECKKREVLFLPNEDRMENVLKRFRLLNAKDIKGLHIMFNWINRGNEAVNRVRNYIKVHSKVRLVIIDCLATVRGDSNSRAVYLDDYKEMQRWRSLCHELNITIFIVHHKNKPIGLTATEGDVMDLINGSNGYGGAVDRTMVLVRARDKPDAKLFSMGRDSEDLFLSLKWERPEESDGWHIKGTREEIEDDKDKIIIIMKENGGQMRTGQIAKIAEITSSAVVQRLDRLSLEGKVIKVSHGLYKLSREED